MKLPRGDDDVYSFLTGGFVLLQQFACVDLNAGAVFND